MSDRTFGEISGIPVGSSYVSRQEMSRLGIHRPTQAGISGSATEGADSIVLSGGYEDDEDFDDVIVYTGHGGQDPVTRQQISNQELTRQNLALAVSMQQGLPVRVIRGSTHRSPNSPKSGYRYDGLYTVERYWHERGAAGFKVWRYRLVLRSDATANEGPIAAIELSGGNSTPSRSKVSVSRIIRDTALSAEI
jgi:putative restriction endonuclease